MQELPIVETRAVTTPPPDGAMGELPYDSTHGPQGIPGLFHPDTYDAAVPTYGDDGVTAIVYSLLGVQNQRVDLTYDSGLLVQAVVTKLPEATTIRTITWAYTDGELTGWAIT